MSAVIRISVSGSIPATLVLAATATGMPRTRETGPITAGVKEGCHEDL